MKLNILDLELNQPSQKIIEIGAVALDVKSGEILDEFHRFVNPEEPLDSYIKSLTGITQAQVDAGMGIKLALEQLGCWFYSKTVGAWGDDAFIVNQQARDLELMDWPRGLRCYDLLPMADVLRCAIPNAGGGGLSKTLETFGIPFEGRPHRALDDAKNTAFLVNRLVSMVKKSHTAELLFAR